MKNFIKTLLYAAMLVCLLITFAFLIGLCRTSFSESNDTTEWKILTEGQVSDVDDDSISIGDEIRVKPGPMYWKHARSGLVLKKGTAYRLIEHGREWSIVTVTPSNEKGNEKNDPVR